MNSEVAVEMNEDGPLVSVILPTYNRRDILPIAMESVLKQSYRHLELIVIDDASTDATERFVRSLADSRIRYHRLDVNKGVAAARNLGIALAQGDLLAFQDSDDLWMDNKLAEQVNSFRGDFRQALISIGRVRRELPGGLRVWPPFGDEFSGRQLPGLGWLFLTTTAYVQSLVVPVQVFQSAGGFDESLPAFEDWDLLLRLHGKTKLRFCPNAIVESVQRADSLTVDRDRVAKAFVVLLGKHRRHFLFHPRAYAALHAYIGRERCEAGQFRQAMFHALMALRCVPVSRTAWRIIADVFRAALTKSKE